MKVSITILALSVFLSACGPNSDCGGSGADLSYGASYVPDTGEGCSSGGTQKKKVICNLLESPDGCAPAN